MRRILRWFLPALLLAFATGCTGTDKLLEEQTDEVCACKSFECGMSVLDGPKNKRLKAMDKIGLKLSEEGRRHKAKMMSCLLSLKANESTPAGTTTTTGADQKTVSAASPSSLGTPFTSSAGKFSAVFPLGAPDVKVTTDRKNIRWNEAKSTVGAYTVGYADFATQKQAQAYVADFIKTMQRGLVSNEGVTVGSGSQGRELTMKVSETATLWLRIVVVDKRVYKISAGTKNDKARAYTFLNSVKLD